MVFGALRNRMQKAGPQRAGAKTPGGARICAIGDVHGCAGKLDALLERIAEDDARAGSAAQLVFLGDYVDRGADSRRVLERLIALSQTRADTVFLKGNHEDVLLAFLADPAGSAQWLHWGGVETLESYDVAAEAGADPAAIAARARAAIPAAHLDFLRRLALYRVIGDYLFVHAGLRPGKPIEEQAEKDLLWIRGEFHRAPPSRRPAQVVVHGHQPVHKPLDAGWRIDVDTGACFGGELTAVMLAGEERRFISA